MIGVKDRSPLLLPLVDDYGHLRSCILSLIVTFTGEGVRYVFMTFPASDPQAMLLVTIAPGPVPITNSRMPIALDPIIGYYRPNAADF